MAGNGSNEVSNWEFFRDLMWIDPFLDERAALVFVFKFKIKFIILGKLNENVKVVKRREEKMNKFI